MEVTVSNASLTEVAADWLVVPVAEEGDFAPQVQQLDDALSGMLTRLRESGDITGKPGSITSLPGVTGIAASRVLLVGVGPRPQVMAARLRRSIMTAARRISDRNGLNIACSLVEPDTTTLDQSQVAPHDDRVDGRLHRSGPLQEGTDATSF